MSSTKTFEAEVDVDLAEWDDDELVQELLRRNVEPGATVDIKAICTDLYVTITTDDVVRRDEILRTLIYKAIGRVLPESRCR